ncbi:ATP-binding protein [Vibrio profundum]|uniref:ATP-binding protein n=1 Tax=Vibrio profundum TaxID=2910247 RepID=UPI003D116502
MAGFTRKFRLVYVFLIILFIIDLAGLFNAIPENQYGNSLKINLQAIEYMCNSPLYYELFPTHIIHIFILLVIILALFIPLERHTLKQVREKKQLELQSQLKSEYLTTISHEIRTPLNGITGALELLKHSDLDYSQSYLVELAAQCSDGLFEVINNVLDFSRIEAGQMKLAMKSTELLPIFDQAMLTIATKANDKNIQLRILATKQVPQKSIVDPTRVKQILINLLGNAIKFTEQGFIFLYVDSTEHQLHISVEDSGVGIAKKMQHQIFQPYTQCTDDSQGSGLGLAITRSLVGLMGGTINLKSELGHGTTVSVNIPLKGDLHPLRFPNFPIRAPLALHSQLSLWGITPILDNESPLQNPDFEFLCGRLYHTVQDMFITSQPDSEPEEIPQIFWRLKILIIDDIEANLDIIGQMIEKMGHNVYKASNGFDALNMAKRKVFDLVFMDIRMPRMNGLELIKKWRSLAEVLDPDCFIAALTANTHPKEKQHIQQAGFNDYLQKPMKMNALHQVILNAYHIQVSRGIDFTPAVGVDQRLLQSNNPEMNKKLMSDLKKQLNLALKYHEFGNTEKLMNHIHTIKGSAALGGFTLLSEAAEQLESEYRMGHDITQKKILSLEKLFFSA